MKTSFPFKLTDFDKYLIKKAKTNLSSLLKEETKELADARYIRVKIQYALGKILLDELDVNI